MITSPRELRQAIRAGHFKGLTTGHASGFVQANLAVLPAALAADFVAFCKANAQACPVLAVSEPGNRSLPALGDDIDVRTDLPAYRVYRDGRHVDTPTDISSLWQNDHVAVAIGCWFSMEDALTRLACGCVMLSLVFRGRCSVPTGRASGSDHSAARSSFRCGRSPKKTYPSSKKSPAGFRASMARLFTKDRQTLSASPISEGRISAKRWTFCRVRCRCTGAAD